MKKAIGTGVVAALTALAVSATSFAGPSAPGPAAQKSAPVKVGMRDNFYKPAVVTVPVGGTVKWTNRGQAQHSATQIGGGFDTGLFGTGVSRKVKFARAGTFKYVCSIHPKMKGTVRACKPGKC
jgi:plastocyanin